MHIVENMTHRCIYIYIYMMWNGKYPEVWKLLYGCCVFQKKLLFGTFASLNMYYTFLGFRAFTYFLLHDFTLFQNCKAILIKPNSTIFKDHYTESQLPKGYV